MGHTWGWFQLPGASVALLWPATSVVAGIVVIAGARVRHFVAAGAGILAAELILAEILLDATLWAAVLWSVANIVTALALAWVARLVLQGDPGLDRDRSLAFLIAGCLLLPALSGLLGAAVSTATYGGSYVLGWIAWWLSDSLAAAVLIPALVIWIADRQRVTLPLVAVTAAVAAVGFGAAVMGETTAFAVTALFLPALVAASVYGRGMVGIPLVGGISGVFLAANATGLGTPMGVLRLNLLAASLVTGAYLVGWGGTRRRTATLVAASEQEMAAAFELSPSALMLVADSGAVLRRNPAAEAFLENLQLSDRTNLFDTVQPVQQASLKKAMANDGATVLAFTDVETVGNKWVRFEFSAAGDEATHVCHLADAANPQVTQLARQALVDDLTGLANRRGLEHEAKAMVQGGPSDLIAVIYMDVDNFKWMNDTFGHQFGDKALAVVAAHMRQNVRAGDVLARVAGDEFICLAGVDSSREAVGIAEQLRESTQSATVRDLGIPVTLSVGVAVVASGRFDLGDELIEADRAMYRAKRAGRNQVVSASVAGVESPAPMTEAELRSAVMQGRIRVHYQQMVHADDRIGVEALARLEAPTGDLVGPADFIPLAESSRLIGPVTEQVLAAACRDAARWEADTGRDVELSVNMAPQLMQDREFAERCLSIVRSEGFDPEHLILEIMETGLLGGSVEPRTSTGYGEANFRYFTSAGVRFAIDDFGTGYSSMQYLLTAPVHRVKLDQSFVRRLPDDETSRAVASGLAGVAVALDLELVAEGVETEAQASALMDFGYRWLQGFLYSRPTAAEQLGAERLESVAAALSPSSRQGTGDLRAGMHREPDAGQPRAAT